MFEKEVEEYVMREDVITENDRVPFDNGYGFQTVSFEDEVKKGFQDGAEFGYNKAKEDADKMKNQFLELCNLKDMRIEELNKANEWHYVKDGDLPKEDLRPRTLGYYLTASKHKSYKGFVFEVAYFTGVIFTKGGDILDNVIAWKKIVLPELKESE